MLFSDATVNKKICSLSFWFNKNGRTSTFCPSFNCNFALKTNPKLWYLLHDDPFVSCLQSNERLNARPSGAVNLKNTTRTITGTDFVRFRNTFSRDISYNSIASGLTFKVTRTVFNSFNKNDNTPTLCTSFNCNFALKTNPKLWYLLRDDPFVSCLRSNKCLNARPCGAVHLKSTTPLQATLHLEQRERR